MYFLFFLKPLIVVYLFNSYELKIPSVLSHTKLFMFTVKTEDNYKIILIMW